MRGSEDGKSEPTASLPLAFDSPKGVAVRAWVAERSNSRDEGLSKLKMHKLMVEDGGPYFN